VARKDSLQAKLDQLQEKAAQAGLDGEEKKQVDAEIRSVTKQLAKYKLRPFHYSHQGSLAFVFFILWIMARCSLSIFTGISVQIRLSPTFHS
jgi:hypothetical protein